MTTIAIPATIKQAGVNDIFVADMSVIPNMLYFFYKPAERRFAGAFFLHDSYDTEELLLQVNDGMIYTLAFGMDGFDFNLQLRTANAQDLKDGKHLRYGYMYYLRLEPTVIEGPYFLNVNTDINMLARWLKNAQLYVVDSKQSFTPTAAQQHSA